MRQFYAPNDWVEEEGGFNVALFCYPDSPQWRAIIRGLFRELASAWLWDSDNAVLFRDLGREIEDSVMMDCKEMFERMADCLCLMASGPTTSIPKNAIYNGDKCLFSRQLVGVAYYWVTQLASIKPNTELGLNVLGILTSFLPVESALNAYISKFVAGVTFLLNDASLTALGVAVPKFELRPLGDYAALKTSLEINKATLIDAVYQACYAIDAKSAYDEAVDNLSLPLWQENYLKNILTEEIFLETFGGHWDSSLDREKLAEWTTYVCQGQPCDPDYVGPSEWTCAQPVEYVYGSGTIITLLPVASLRRSGYVESEFVFPEFRSYLRLGGGYRVEIDAIECDFDVEVDYGGCGCLVETDTATVGSSYDCAEIQFTSAGEHTITMSIYFADDDPTGCV